MIEMIYLHKYIEIIRCLQNHGYDYNYLNEMDLLKKKIPKYCRFRIKSKFDLQINYNMK